MTTRNDSRHAQESSREKPDEDAVISAARADDTMRDLLYDLAGQVDADNLHGEALHARYSTYSELIEQKRLQAANPKGPAR